MQKFLLTSLTMIAFAANSVLCRKALLDENIDAASFSLVRIVSGALVLSLLVFLKTKNLKDIIEPPKWFFAIALSAYVVFFSYSYINISAAAGALVLFTSVQFTMLAYSFFQGQRYSFQQWLAYAICVAGFLVLLVPGASQPALLPAFLMLVAGVAWGTYTLLASNAGDPLRSVQQAFFWSVPIVAVLIGVAFYSSHVSVKPEGILLAVLSGAITSGLGYFLWYKVLKRITSFAAAIAQLSVPVITALMGVVFLGEDISAQLVVAASLILAGLSITILRNRSPQQ